MTSGDTRAAGVAVRAGADWESGAVVIRRGGPAHVVVPRSDEATPLTEDQVSGGSPVARLVNAHPWVPDVAAACLVLLVGLVGAMFAWEAAAGAQALGLYPEGSGIEGRVTTTWLVGTAAGAALLLLRRVRPLTVTALLVVACLVSLLVSGVLGVLGLCLAFAMSTVAATREPRTTWAVLGGVLVTVTLALWRWQDLGLIEILAWFGSVPSPTWEPETYLAQPLFSPGRRAGSVLLLHTLLLLGVAVGSAARARRQHAHDLVERYRALVRERDQGAALARADERAHIAREMHDVVAHNLSVMVALADGADAAFERAPDRSRDAVRQVARTGRAALADMQRVLGALGPVPDADQAQEPTDVDLPTVVERFGAAGLPVRATGLDVALPQDTAVRLAVLRILGEALTNVLRHAPGSPSVEVAVRRTPTTVEVDVVDAGGTRPGDGPGTGRGVVGMRERAALLGGHVDAGPTPDGGWRVHAVLPADDDGGAR
ncbi:sensor histidine kinase [Cellulomonas sp. SLBN-39]|uniref:sensor histidine kinase n=1 Tax=Cellulomonas sp. SLBN-39 TaxID=2768446 RepID=UPI00115281CD|nr:histidine kinase [Cellulomonas sp. SLBN-39]TQL02648.1 signal transduction histidine kinase [Cellulomonas sp. SLBN-39]